MPKIKGDRNIKHLRYHHVLVMVLSQCFSLLSSCLMNSQIQTVIQRAQEVPSIGQTVDWSMSCYLNLVQISSWCVFLSEMLSQNSIQWYHSL